MFITFVALPYYWIRSLFVRKYGDTQRIYKEMKMYPRHFFGIRGKSVRSIGDTTDKYDTCVYISNHQSHNDIFITLAAINKPIRFIAKKELFTSFVTGTFMKMSRSYPLDRENPRQSLTILKNAVDDVAKGYSVLAFPEGTRSHQKEMLPFKDGIFAMLRKVKVPIVPMYIKESYNEKQKEFSVYFGEPILPEQFSEMRGADLSDFVRSAMEDLKAKAYEAT